jgi:putative Holliday junction resolvase
MSRYLALDVGNERIGLAISDERGQLARPLEVIARLSGHASFEYISDLVSRQAIEVVIVGWPLLADGAEGAQVRSTAAYVRGLAKYIAKPIVHCDERNSTIEANGILASDGLSRRRVRRNRDAVSAAVILQHYLDEKAQGVV